MRMAGEEIAPGGVAAEGGVVAEAPAAVIVAPEAPAVVEAAPEAAPAAIVEAPAEPVAEPAAEPVVEPAPVVAEAPKPEVAAEPAPAPEPIVYQEFKLPEGIQAAPEQIEAFTGLASKFGLNQEAAQELMDLHSGVLKQFTDGYAKQVDQRQLDVFAETRAGWRKDVDKRFGNRRDTTVNDARSAVDLLITDPKARKELRDVLDFSGVGDHPAIIGWMAAATKALRERAAPPKGLPPKGVPARAADRRYGGGAQT
jgi:hypothetical protein